jgi:hypothetical protein
MKLFYLIDNLWHEVSHYNSLCATTVCGKIVYPKNVSREYRANVSLAKLTGHTGQDFCHDCYCERSSFTKVIYKRRKQTKNI